MKQLLVVASLVLCVFCTFCSGPGRPQAVENTALQNAADPNFHTIYRFEDVAGKHLIVQNGYPRGGVRYTDPEGEEYGYAVFWTRFINETDHPVKLEIDFSEWYEVPSSPGKFFKLMVPPDTMTIDRVPLYGFGLTGLESFLDTSIQKSSSLRRIINPNDSSGFYVIKLRRAVEVGPNDADILRTGLSLEGQDLYYTVSVYNSKSPPSLNGEEKIKCGRINLNGLRLLK